MSTFDLSSVPAYRSDTEAPFMFGRADQVNRIVDYLRAGYDVIVEGEAGLGKANLRESVIHVAKRMGLYPVTFAQYLTGNHSPLQVIVDDFDVLTPANLSVIAHAHDRDGVRFVLTRRPPHPFASHSDFARIQVVEAAVAMTLEPLTAEQNDALVEEQVARRPLRWEPALFERRWVWINSRGFPQLAVSLLHDVDESPVEEGSLTMLSRRTLLEASRIVAGLPAPMHRLASQLLPLIGVSMSRLQRFFSPVELALLAESHVVDDYDDMLWIAPPLAAALRMVSDAGAPSEAALDVVSDICASMMLDADCSEHEITIAASTLTASAMARTTTDPDVQLAVLTMAMWLARRRGEATPAAALARRIMTLFPDAATEAVRRIARHEPDDIPALTAALKRGELPRGVDPALWGLCLQIPLAAAPAGLDELLDAIVSIRPESATYVTAFRISSHAAAALDTGNLDEAYELASTLLPPHTASPHATIRAFTVIAAVFSARLNHTELLATADAFVAYAREHRSGSGLERDLLHHGALEALGMIALCFGAAGLRLPKSLSEYLREALVDSFVQSDPARVALASATHILHASQHDQRFEVAGDVRFLRRERRTALSNWIITRVTDRSRETPPPPFSTPSLTYAGNLTQALTGELQRGNVAFADAIADIPVFDIPVLTIARAYLAAVAGAQVPPIEQVDGLMPDTVPGAMRDYVEGTQQHDPHLLRRSAHTFHGLGAAEQAQASLDALAPLVNGDTAFERTLRPIRRSVNSMLRTVADKDQRLTPRELEVCLLAAQGVNNTDIARRLFLSVRTVESHIYRATKKLAVDRDGLNPSLLLRHADV